jgi:hypothetical protein
MESFTYRESFMVNFLFWNIGGRPIRSLVANVARSVDADCIVLCECTLNPGEMVESLNQKGPDYRYALGHCEHLMFFTRFDPNFLLPKFENSRVSIRHLSLPARKDILLVGAHLPSGLYNSRESLTQECSFLARYINDQEQLVGHKRTLVVGDLNVNPFESGVVGTAGLHAVLSRVVASKGSRTVQDVAHHFFYNPMWSCFGDRTDGPPGTYYYDRAEAVNYFWNIYDQVLLRPDLLDGFDIRTLRIVTAAGDSTLVDDSGRPDKKNASDHLPIAFSVNF